MQTISSGCGVVTLALLIGFSAQIASSWLLAFKTYLKAFFGILFSTILFNLFQVKLVKLVISLI